MTFLNSELKEEVYVSQPEGFVDQNNPSHVCNGSNTLHTESKAYRKGTINMGLWYSKDTGMSLTTYADADHPGCQDPRRSASGSAQFLGGEWIVELYFVRMEYELANIFTKPFPREIFDFLIEKLDVSEVYMHRFWVSVYKHDTFYIFKMDKKKRFKLTLEIFRDIVKICPRAQGQDFDALPTDEEIMSFLRELRHTREINSLNDVVVDHMHQPWRTFAALINKALSGKTTGLDKPRLSRVQILWDKTISWRNKIEMHTSKDDYLINTLRFLSAKEATQIYGAIIPESLTSPEMKETKAYQTYLGLRGVFIRETLEMPLSKKKKKVDVARGKGIELISKVALIKEAQYEEVRKKSLRDFHKTHPIGSGTVTKTAPSLAKIKPSITNEGASVKPEVTDVTEEDEKGSDYEHETDENESDSKSDQEENEEEIGDDEKEEEDEFVRTPSNDSDDETKIYDKAEGDKDEEMDYTTSQLYDDVDIRMNEPTDADEGFIQKEEEMSNFPLPPVIQRIVTRSFEHAILAKVSAQPQSSYEAADSLTKFELKKILIDKMDKSESYLADRGLKKRKTSKDAEPTKGLKAKESQSGSSRGTKSQSKSFGKSVQSEELEFEALSEKLDWENPEGGDYPFDLTKPLPLVMNGNHQMVPVNYFFNNDLKYLQGGILTMTYTTSLTKTKAAQYDLRGIEDMVPNIWSPVKVSYDKHALWGISHRIDQRKSFYGYARGLESTHDVYSTKRILVVTQVKIIRKHGYGYLKEIVVRRADNDLYKLKEGDFPRIRINDIEDMLLLVVHNRLTNLSGDDVSNFAIALRMFTISIVIQKRVEDL
nr:hypothetical protein [Tanacetum cinerariifolium]GEW52315.1 hypothetical protein [Tanacetum cinerariifolium]